VEQRFSAALNTSFSGAGFSFSGERWNKIQIKNSCEALIAPQEFLL
jgi:hypothetical protein